MKRRLRYSLYLRNYGRLVVVSDWKSGHISSAFKKEKKKEDCAITGQSLPSVPGKIMEQDPSGNYAKPHEKQDDR